MRHDKDHPWPFDPSRYADRAAWQRRVEWLRTRSAIALGLWPMPPRPAVKAVVTKSIERAEYTVQNVYFASLPGHYVTGNLYLPKKPGKKPAVICPHGHWPNGRWMWRTDEQVEKEIATGAEFHANAARTPLQARCAMLARMGCIAFTFDAVGSADSSKLDHREGFRDADALLNLQSMMGLHMWNAMRSLDFLAAREDVDAKRIAAGGASGGATQSIALSILDNRISALGPAVMVSMNMQGGCVCENAPLYRLQTNNVELAATFAPKPLCMAAAQDWTKDFETRGLPEMKKIYSLFGNEDNVTGKFFPFGHNDNVHGRELFYNFLNRHFQLGIAEQVHELDFDPIAPVELAVFDNEHPRPADEIDADGVRGWMSNTAAEAIAKETKNDPAKLAQLQRTALRAMIGDEDDEVSFEGAHPPADHHGDWLGTIRRVYDENKLNVRAIIPDNWNGQTTIWSHPAGLEAMKRDEIDQILNAGAAVFSLDKFDETPIMSPQQLEPFAPNGAPRYGGFWLGYNRAPVAQRAHDLLTLLLWLRSWSKIKHVTLIAKERAAVSALIAGAIDRAKIDDLQIDIGDFDFANITDDADPMLLPGIEKFGGVAMMKSLAK